MAHTFADEEDVVRRKERNGGFESMSWRFGGVGLRGGVGGFGGLRWLGGLESRTFGVVMLMGFGRFAGFHFCGEKGNEKGSK